MALTCPNKMEGLGLPRYDLDPGVSMVTYKVNNNRMPVGGTLEGLQNAVHVRQGFHGNHNALEGR